LAVATAPVTTPGFGLSRADADVAVRIVADDLTGAADAAAPFATADAPIPLLLGPAAWPGSAAVVAIDANTRELEEEAAAAVVAGIVQRCRPRHGLLKKIDSLLRGNTGAELAALQRCFPQRLMVVAPAFPAMRRVTVEGVQHVDGRRLEPRIDVRLGGRLRVRLVNLATVRSAPTVLARHLEAARVSGAAAICDAATDRDLDAIVEAGRQAAHDTIWAGAAGLAAALARVRGRTTAHRPDLERVGGAHLALVGSTAEAARRQVAALGDAGVQILTLSGAMLAASRPAELASVAADITDRMTREGSLAVTVAGPPMDGHERRIAHALAEVTADAASRSSLVILTGGATARAALDRWRSSAVSLHGELEMGVVLGRPLGAIRPWVVTKAGSFGEDNVLVRILHHAAGNA
jgi:uncharacterized protein YgbK (DUF1537 family)